MQGDQYRRFWASNALFLKHKLTLTGMVRTVVSWIRFAYKKKYYSSLHDSNAWKLFKKNLKTPLLSIYNIPLWLKL